MRRVMDSGKLLLVLDLDHTLLNSTRLTDVRATLLLTPCALSRPQTCILALTDMLVGSMSLIDVCVCACLHIAPHACMMSRNA